MFRSTISSSLGKAVAQRFYASSAKVEPPTRVYGLAGRYAHALYSAACINNVLPAVESELIIFQDLLASSLALKNFLVNPSMPKQAKKEAIRTVLTKSSFSPMTMDFFDILTDNIRLNQTLPIINAFKVLMRAHKKEVECVVTTAKPLDSGKKEAVAKQLQRFLAPGEKILLESKVDPKILGGLVVEIGDRRIDMSVNTRIKNLADLLRSSA